MRGRGLLLRCRERWLVGWLQSQQRLGIVGCGSGIAPSSGREGSSRNRAVLLCLLRQRSCKGRASLRVLLSYVIGESHGPGVSWCCACAWQGFPDEFQGGVRPDITAGPGWCVLGSSKLRGLACPSGAIGVGQVPVVTMIVHSIRVDTILQGLQCTLNLP